MVDRNAREELAAAIRHFASGSITNREFEGRIPRSPDPAVHGIENAVWRVYDDFLVHRLSGPFALTLGMRRDLARAVLFLKGDLTFEWPGNVNEGNIVTARWIAALTAGLWHPRLSEPAAGDRRVWPFFRMDDYAAALRHPPYLQRK